MKKKNLVIGTIVIFLAAFAFGAIFAFALQGNNDEKIDKQTPENDEKKPIAATNLDEQGLQESAEEEGIPVVEQEVKKDVMVAWQPSHQDDTGDASWHEYEVCNDLVERAMPLCTSVESVKCWDISNGLTGTNRYDPQPTNTPAFDAEIAMANQAQADYFISVHNDGGAPSGILGLCMPGDSLSRAYLEQFVAALCASTGLPNRGIWEVRLYSLEPERNSCPVRFILEIGDNVKDRDKLMDPGFRQLVAQTLANVVNSLASLR